MLKRTIGLLGRLVGRSSSSDGAPASTRDRRIWVRYPCNLRAGPQSAEVADAIRLSGTVRDISQGGMNLVVERAFEPGTVLSVELPGDHESPASTILACVIHAKAQPEGMWTLGCTFAAELDDEELRPFGAKRLRPSGPDQRTWVRFPCDMQVIYHAARPPGASQSLAKVVDISPGGLCLLVARPIDVGTLLSLNLCAAAQGTPLSILACVVHVTTQAGGECKLGCNFIRELSLDELEACCESASGVP